MSRNKLNINCQICLQIFFCIIYGLLISSVSAKVNKESSRHIILFKGEYKNIPIELLAQKDFSNTMSKFYLRILESKMSFEIFNYLCFKNEPYLSHSIALICPKDTIHPSITAADRAYEAGKEMIYLMAFDTGKLATNCKKEEFDINNFLGIGDTLRIKLPENLPTQK